MKPVKLIPMLFSTDMARANMNGSKRMTRRTRALDEMNADPDSWIRGTMFLNKKGELMQTFFGPGMTERGINVKCPYGKPGDVMWMREAWYYLGDNASAESDKNRYHYQASAGKNNFTWKPNLHMRLEACRFFAEIVEMGCERLQDITEDDAIEEGLRQVKATNNGGEYGSVVNQSFYHNAKEAYFVLWESINGRGSSRKNPYVWVIKYRRLDADELMDKLPALLLNQKAEKQQRIRRVVMNYRLMNGKEATV